VINVIRPTWVPANDEQRQLLVAAVRAARKATEAARKAEELEAAAWAAILKAREADVPDTALCDQTGFSRASLNRKFGTRASATEGGT
jgi:hypothetical protein